eukprot:1008407-Prymnesium_polylepis.1
MSEFSTRVTVNSMEDVGDPSTVSFVLIRLFEARAKRQPFLALRGVRSGPHTTFPHLTCASFAFKCVSRRRRTVRMGCVSCAS